MRGQNLRGLPRDVPADVWVALALVVEGTRLRAEFRYHPDDARFAVAFPNQTAWIVTYEQFDELERRGWIDATGDTVVPTERGHWRYRQWSKNNTLTGVG